MDVIKVNDGLYRGPQPETADEFDDLQQLGIKSVIALDGLASVAINEHKWLTDRGILAQLYPLSGVTCPTFDQIEAILNLIDSEPKPVYVHCFNGTDRTGVVCAGVAVRSGVPVGDAMGEMIRLGFNLSLYQWWMSSIQELLVKIGVAG